MTAVEKRRIAGGRQKGGKRRIDKTERRIHRLTTKVSFADYEVFLSFCRYKKRSKLKVMIGA